MPSYDFIVEDDLDTRYSIAKISAMRKLGVPYEEGFEDQVGESMSRQATAISESILKDLKGSDYTSEDLDKLKRKEVVALIAYMQRLGSDIHKDSEQVLGDSGENK